MCLASPTNMKQLSWNLHQDDAHGSAQPYTRPVWSLVGDYLVGPAVLGRLAEVTTREATQRQLRRANRGTGMRYDAEG